MASLLQLNGGGKMLMAGGNAQFAGLKFTAIDTCVFTLTIGSDVSTSNLQYVEFWKFA